MTSPATVPGSSRPRRSIDATNAREVTVYLVGLTGGIGSGKSTVARRLAELGAEIIDADAVAREIVEPGEPALDGLVERFGDGILAEDGSLDRQALAALAFADDAARADLDRLTHPYIAARIARRVAELAGDPQAAPDDLVVVDHPLLIETGQAGRFDAVVVVLAGADLRVARLVEDRGMDPDDVRARMRAQVDDDRRREAADHLVVNDGPLDVLIEQVDEVHRSLTEAARSASQR